MILFFGPTGSGKSLQGKILEEKYGFKLISPGQLLRDSNDDMVKKIQERGDLVDDNLVDNLVERSLKTLDKDKVVIDGFARHMSQARWLVEKFKSEIELVIVINVDQKEIMKRLNYRERDDDSEQSILHRLEIYENETKPVLEYFSNEGIKIANIDGNNTIEEVNDRIEKVLRECELI